MVNREELIDMIEDLSDYASENKDAGIAGLLMAIVGAYDIGRLGGLIKLVKKFIDEEIVDHEAYHN